MMSELTYRHKSTGASCDICGYEDGNRPCNSKCYYRCELAGCGREGIFRACGFHLDDLNQVRQCHFCKRTMCRSHIHWIKDYDIIMCRHCRHIDWKYQIQKQMDIIGNKYMVGIILEYMI